MKSTHILALWLTLSLLLSTVVCHADGDTAARREIQSRYNQFNKAYTNKDFKRAGEIFSPDCVMKLSSEGRSMKAARALTGMKAVSKSLTVTNAKTQILTIKPIREGFEVSAVWTGDSKYVPVNNAKDDPPRQAKTKQVYKDTWKKSEKGWQITHRIIGEADDDAKPQTKKKP